MASWWSLQEIFYGGWQLLLQDDNSPLVTRGLAVGLLSVLKGSCSAAERVPTLWLCCMVPRGGTHCVTFGKPGKSSKQTAWLYEHWLWLRARVSQEIQGSGPERYISTIYHAWDIPEPSNCVLCLPCTLCSRYSAPQAGRCLMCSRSTVLGVLSISSGSTIQYPPCFTPAVSPDCSASRPVLSWSTTSHIGSWTHWTWKTLNLWRIEPGVSRTWSTIWDTADCGHTEPETQQTVATLNQRHSRLWSHWTRDTADCGHTEPGTQQTVATLNQKHSRLWHTASESPWSVCLRFTVSQHQCVSGPAYLRPNVHPV